MTILLADAGATKTDWLKLTVNKDDDINEEAFPGAGISPTVHDIETIEEELRLVRAALGYSFDRIRFYGTGVGSPFVVEKMMTVLSEAFDCADIIVESDMAGAARAVLGDNPGVACIMGTGSNSCHFNGHSIDKRAVSLGFILDDDGGGVAFSRRLISDVFKGIAPEEIVIKFQERYSLSVMEVIDHLYHSPSPGSWIAGFMPFVMENSTNPYMSVLIESQISKFFDREFIIYQEDQLKEEGIGFVGSVAYLLSDRISKEMEMRGWKLKSITAKPMDNLKKLELATITIKSDKK